MKQLALSFLFQILSFTSIYGQLNLKGVPLVTYFAKKEYKAGAEIREVIHFKNHVYFATDKGLAILEGNRWETLCTDYSIYSIEIDSVENRIFIGGEREFGFFYNNHLNCEDYYSLSKQLKKEDQDFNEVSDIEITKKGVFFTTQNKRFLFKNNVLEVSSEISQSNRYKFKAISKINNTLFKVNKHSVQHYSIDSLNTGLEFSGDHILTLLPSNRDSFLIVTRNGGVFHLPLNSWIRERAWKDTNDFFEDTPISCAIRLSNGNYAIGTLKKGILIIDNKGKSLFHLFTKNGLPSNTIQCLYQDHLNNLWVGLDNGIAYLNLNSSFTKIYTSSNVQGKAHSSYIKNSFLYLLTSDGVFYADLKKSKNVLNPTEFQLIKGTEGTAFTIEPIGDYLLLGHQKGVLIIKDNQLLNEKSINLEDNWIFKTVLNQPYIIAGTSSGLVNYHKELILSGSEESIHEWYTPIKGFNNPCRNFLIDNNNHVWVADIVNGLYELTLNEQMDSVIGQLKYDENNHLPAGKVKIFEGINRNIYNSYITTQEGIYKYNKSFEQNEDFKEIRFEGDFIRQIVPIPNSNKYWYASDLEFGILEHPSFDSVKLIKYNSLVHTIVTETKSILTFGKNNEDAIIGTLNGFYLFKNSIANELIKDFNLYVTRKEENNLVKLSLSTDFFQDWDKIRYSYRFLLKGQNNSEWLTADNHRIEFFLNSGIGDTIELRAENTLGSVVNIKRSTQVNYFWDYQKIILFLLVLLFILLSCLIYFYRKDKKSVNPFPFQKFMIERLEKMKKKTTKGY